MGNYIRVEGLRKTFGEKTVLEDVSFQLQEGQMLMLVGASGCGKTTLLRTLAGLERADAGSFYVDGGDAFAAAVGKRDVSLMFQEPFLFPHMNVRENIAFPLRCLGMKQAVREEQANMLMEKFKLLPMAKQHPFALSGGQKQRVSLARALITKPKLLLLDEPLSSLDVSLGKEIRIWMVEMLQALAISTIFVTHKYEEAVLSSEHIAVMKEGRLYDNSSTKGRQEVLSFFEEGIFYEETFVPLEQWRFAQSGVPVVIQSFIMLHGVRFAAIRLEDGQERLLPATSQKMGRAYIQPRGGEVHA